MECAGIQGPGESGSRASVGCLERGERDLMGQSNAAVGEEVGAIPGYDDTGHNAGKETNGSRSGAQG